jgi:hypothetical protein
MVRLLMIKDRGVEDGAASVAFRWVDGAAAEFHRAAKQDEGRREIRGVDGIQCSGKKGETK